MANRSVVLYQRPKIKKEWTYRKVSEDLAKLTLGDYCLSRYVGSRKRLPSVGSDPKKALKNLEKKRLELAYVAAGGEVNRSDVPLDGEGQRKRVSSAVKDYLEDCVDRQGKSGYGLAARTPETYEYRLGFLIEFRPDACLDEVNAEFIKAFRRFLRNHPRDLSDRTCYNIMQAVSTFLLQYGIASAIRRFGGQDAALLLTTFWDGTSLLAHGSPKSHQPPQEEPSQVFVQICPSAPLTKMST